MKKLSLLLSGLLVIAACTFSSCSSSGDDEVVNPPDPDSLLVGTNRVSFQYDDLGAREVSVTTNVTEGYTHEITEGDWFDVEKTEDGIEITPKSINDDTENERTGNILITAGNATPHNIAVIQSKNGVVVIEDQLRVGTNRVSFGYDEVEGRDVAVTTNVEAGFVPSITEGDWFDVAKTDEGIRITPKSANDDTEKERTGSIRITAGDANAEVIEVTQAKNGFIPEDPYLNVDPTTVVFKKDEAITPQRINVDTNIEEGYEIYIFENYDWVTIEHEEADYFTFTVGEWNFYEDRAAEIKVTAGDFTRTVQITQEATVDMMFDFELVTNVDPMNLGTEVSSVKYVETTSTNYTGNYNFTVTPWEGGSEDDITVSIANGNSGLGEDAERRYLTIQFGANVTEEVRNFSVTIIAVKDTDKEMTLNFSQEAVEAIDVFDFFVNNSWDISYTEGDSYFGGETVLLEDVIYFGRYSSNPSRMYALLLVDNPEYDPWDPWSGFPELELRIVFNLADDGTLTSVNNSLADGYVAWNAAIGNDESTELNLGTNIEWEYDLKAETPYLRPKPVQLSNGQTGKLVMRYAPNGDPNTTGCSFTDIEFRKR